MYILNHIYKKMNDNAYLNFDKTCRACLNNKDVFVSMYNSHLKELFIDLTNLEITEDDGLPSNLCISCTERLNLFYDFRKLCLQSDKTLKQCKIIKTEIEDEITENITDVSINRFLELSYSDKSDLEITIEPIMTTTLHINSDDRNSVLKIDPNKKFTKKSSIKISGETNSFLRDLLTKEETLDELEEDRLFETYDASTFNSYFSCPECKQIFLTLDQLEEHLKYHEKQLHMSRNHSNIAPYTCNLCSKSFKIPSALKIHLLRHYGIKKYKCIICNHGTATKGDLNIHMKIHSQYKPYSCNSCSKKYRTSSQLVQHNRIHTGERPHHCDLCPMKFRLSATLKNHRRIHTGERPHVCGICKKAFTQKIALKTHMKVHS